MKTFCNLKAGNLLNLAPVLGLFMLVATGQSATVTVLVGSSGLSFTPSVANINVNDTVNWSWSGFGHSSTSDTGLWDSGIASPTHNFTRQFTSSGTFPYHCIPHQSFGMTGSIVVAAAANNPPTVSITNSAATKIYTAPADIKLTATASDSDGSVTNVQFLRGSTVLTNEASGPFKFTDAGMGAGSYTYSAIATDNGGLKATNTITLTVVAPSPLTLSNPLRSSPTTFQFNYTANTGLTYFVQSSADLGAALWTTLSTNTATNSTVLFIDSSATNNPGYYRVGRLPNP